MTSHNTTRMTEATSSTESIPEYCLMLLGKTGHGKSATGNSILGKKNVFKSSSTTESVTEYASMASSIVDKRKVKVVDTPGLADTRFESEKSAEAAMDAFTCGVALCSEGFHALLLVFEFGKRMTDEEKNAIEALKEMLGEHIIREYTVLVITHGDTFDPEEENRTFIEWCQVQTGFMSQLLQECGNRCVLFNNRSKDKGELSRQRNELFGYVDGLQSKGRRYENWLFDQAKDVWNNLTKKQKYKKVINEVNDVLGGISSDLLLANECESKMEDAFFDCLREKLRELSILITDLEEPEKGHVLGQIEQMNERIRRVQQEDTLEMRQAEIARLKTLNEELRQQHQEELRKMQDEFKKTQEKMYNTMAEMSRRSEKKRRGCTIS